MATEVRRAGACVRGRCPLLTSQWLFLLEGLFTLAIGLVSWFMMPASVSSTKNIFRPKGYFTETEEKTIVNKVLRDQPSKSDMHNRQRLTFRRLWNALTDYYVWPLYLIGLLFGLPSGPATVRRNSCGGSTDVQSYLTLTLRGLGFSTTATNLLTVPAYSLNIIFLLAATWLSERFKKRALLASFQVFYTIPLLIALISFTRETSPWSKCALATAGAACSAYRGRCGDHVDRRTPVQPRDPSGLGLAQRQLGWRSHGASADTRWL